MRLIIHCFGPTIKMPTKDTSVLSESSEIVRITEANQC